MTCPCCAPNGMLQANLCTRRAICIEEKRDGVFVSIKLPDIRGIKGQGCRKKYAYLNHSPHNPCYTREEAFLAQVCLEYVRPLLDALEALGACELELNVVDLAAERAARAGVDKSTADD